MKTLKPDGNEGIFFLLLVCESDAIAHTHQGLYIHVLILEIKKMKRILRM